MCGGASLLREAVVLVLLVCSSDGHSNSEYQCLLREEVYLPAASTNISHSHHHSNREYQCLLREEVALALVCSSDSHSNREYYACCVRK